MTSTKETKHTTTVIEVPEAVGVFDTLEDLQAAFYDLRMVGFTRYDISLLGRQEVLEEKLGKGYWRAADQEDNPEAPRASFVSQEAIGELEGAIAGGFFFLGSYIAMAAMLTAASTLAASIAAIAIGGSPALVLGALLARRVGKQHKDYNANQIDHGASLLWVRVHDKAQEDLAIKIMKGHSGRDVHVHPWSN